MPERCVCCGEYVPEGMMVCPACQKQADSPAPKSFKRITRVTIMGDYGCEDEYKDPYEEIQILRNALGKYEDIGYTPEQLKSIIGERRV